MNCSEYRQIFPLIACLFVSACGDKVAPGTSEPSVATAGTVAKMNGSAGRAGSGMKAVGGRSGVKPKAEAREVDAAVSDRNLGGAGSGTNRVVDAGSVDDAAVSGNGGAAAGGSAGASGSGDSGSQAAAGGGGIAAASGDAGVPGPTVTLTGQVIQVQANGNFTPYGDAEVCVLDSMPPVCATADASGMLEIELPANSKTGLTMNLPGLFPMLTPITTGDTDINLSGRGQWSNYAAAVVLAEEARTSTTSMLGTTFDMAMGQADMIVFGLSSGIVTLEGTPAELKWFSSGGQFTITNDTAPLGSVLHGFTNVEPGMRTFRAEMNGKPCAFDPMIWPGDQPGTVTVPIRAGWWTRLMEVRCN